MEDGCLAFGTGAGALEMTELGAGGSGIGVDVCTSLGCDLKDVDPGGVGAGIACARCERCKVWAGVFWFGADSVERKSKFLIWLHAH